MKHKRNGQRVEFDVIQKNTVTNKVIITTVVGYEYKMDGKHVVVHRGCGTRNKSKWIASEASTSAYVVKASTKKEAVELFRTDYSKMGQNEWDRAVNEHRSRIAKYLTKPLVRSEVTATKAPKAKKANNTSKSKLGGADMSVFTEFKTSVIKSFAKLSKGTETTDTGYLRRRSHVCMFADSNGKYEWSSVWTRGFLALIPDDILIYKAMWKVIEWKKDKKTGKRKPVETRFDEARFLTIRKEMAKMGYIPMFWHDTGMKSEDGEFRLMPFIKDNFRFTKFFADKFKIDMSGLFTPAKGSKAMKYLNSPWGFLEGTKPTFADILIVPFGFDGLDAEGSGTLKNIVANKRGTILHFRAIATDRNGHGSFGKGTLKQGAAFSSNIKPTTLKKIKAECVKHGIDFNTVTGISTDDSFKGAEAWTVVCAALVWHGDSSRNIKTTASLGTQMIMNAPLNELAIDHIENVIANRKTEVAVARNSGAKRGEMIGRWCNNCAIENDASPDGKDYTNTIVGDRSKLMMITNISPAFGYNERAPQEKRASRTLIVRNREAMGSFLRGRSIGNIRVPGSRMYVVYNQKLGHNECLIGRNFARYHGIKKGDVITTVKSPVGPLSPKNRVVVGLLNDTYKIVKDHVVAANTWIEISNHRGFDFDGDAVDVMSRTYMRYNVELIKHTNKDDGITRDFMKEYKVACAKISKLIDKYSTKITPSAKYLSNVVISYQVLEASRGVGMVEDLRRQFSLTLGQSEAWPMCQAIFDLVSEGILIKGKKHNVQIIFDYAGFCEELIEEYELVRANAHKLITSKRTNDKRIAEQIADPELELINHESADLYEMAFEVACDINELFTMTPEDLKRWKEFKLALGKRYRGWVSTLLESNPDMYHDLITNCLDNNMNFKGDMTLAYNGMKNFYNNDSRFTTANFAHLLGVSVKEATAHPLYKEFYELDGFTKSLNINPNASEVKKIYRELETAWFARLDGYHKIAAICGILNWGVYAWLYVYPAQDYKDIISKVDEMLD
jgi:hypothetical protein